MRRWNAQRWETSATPHAPLLALLLVLFLALGVGPLLACASKSASGGSGKKARKTVVLSTVYDDQAAGEEGARQIEAEMGLYEDATLAAYIEEIGLRLVPYAPHRPFQYQFRVLNQQVPNAFSLPGGHIYLSRGLISLANTEAELANVLGHEIIHAAERHVAAHQELARRTNPLLMPAFRMMQIMAYSRDHERAADRGGQELAARAGYDPAAMADFLSSLGNTERLELGYSRLTSYFATHPGTTERVATTSADAMTLKWTPDTSRPLDRNAYVQRIEGVVLGTDPKEGIFRENEFIHPDMNFRMLFPHGWHLVNNHQAVGASAPDGNAKVVLTARSALPTYDTESDSESAEGPELRPARERPITAAEAAEQFLADAEDEFDVEAVRSAPIRIGEIEAHRLDVQGRMAGVAIRGQVTFIPYNGLIFRLVGLAPGGLWPQYQGRARTVARTFRPLTAEERESVTVSQLRVVRALEGETLAALGQRTGNIWGPGRTAVLNGVFVDVRFREGDLVKIARASTYRAEDASQEP